MYWNLFERTHTAKGTSEQQEALERSPLRRPSYQALAMRRSRVCVEWVGVRATDPNPNHSPQSAAQPQPLYKSR